MRSKRSLVTFSFCALICLVLGGVGSSPASEKEPSGEKPTSHLVKKGENLSGIMIKKYSFSLPQYRRSIPLFKKLNPQIKNINLIFYGLRILIPPRPRAGEMAGLRPGQGPRGQEAPALASVPGAKIEAAFGQAEAGPILKLEQLSEVNVKEAVEEILPKMGLPLKNSGESLYELPPYGRVRLDNRQFPLVQLPGNNYLILDYEAAFPLELKGLFERAWPNYKVVMLDNRAGLKELVDQLFSDSRYFSVSRHQEVSFGEQAKLVLKGDWKIEPSKESLLEGKVTLLNLLEGENQPTPEYVKDYARDYGIEVIEIKGNRSQATPGKPGPALEGMVVSLRSEKKGEVVSRLLQMINQNFEANKPLKLKGEPWTGLELDLQADMFFRREGELYVVSFSGLPAPLISFAQDFGVNIISLKEEDSFPQVVSKVYGGLKIPHTYARYRILADLEKKSSYYDVEVPGFLINHKALGLKKSKDASSFTFFPKETESFILTDVEMNPELAKILEEGGYMVKQYRQ